MRPTQAFHVLRTLREHPSAPLRRKGVELSFNDSQTVLDVYQQWLLLALDLGYLHPESLIRDARRLWADFVQADVLTLNNAFAECLQRVRCQDNKGFKVLCSEISSHLYHMVKEDMGLVLQSNPYAAKRLIQLFSYTLRLSLADIDLTQQQLQDYRDNEDAIPHIYPDSLVHQLNLIIRRWFGTFAPGDIHPQHGPGGTAGLGRCSLEVKYKDLTTDAQLRYAFGDPWWVVGPITSSSDRISQTVFVPKSYKSFRTISMEPTTLQYFQQGVRKLIDSQVLHNSYLRNHIDFHDQERNRLLAREGSVARNFATLDLSAASDLVGYDLVKQLFKGTWLLRYLVVLRSPRTVLPDGSLLTMRKFAPMGSSLCFPIETIVFAAICDHVTQVHRVPGQYSVFGDDIIVPTQCAEYTMRVLTNLGFRTNREKSFFDSACWFRESCGGEYCDGFDVTPMRVSRKYASREQDVRLAKLITLANTAYSYNFRNLRYFFIAKLREEKYTPLFAPTSLVSDNYTNYHAPRRWNRNLQRIEIKASALKSKPNKITKPAISEEIRYRHWLESTAERSTLDLGFKSDIGRSTVTLQDSWLNKPYEANDQAFIDCSLGGSYSTSMS